MKKFIIITAIQAVVIGGCIYGWTTYLFPPEVVAYEVPVEKSIDIEAAISKVQPKLDPFLRGHIAATIQKHAAEYELDPALVVALIARESSFRPMSTSTKGAVGLMQVLPKAHPEKIEGLSEAELYHIDHNIRVGCMILSQYIGAAKTYRGALYRYVGAEYKAYADDVLSIYGEMQLAGR